MGQPKKRTPPVSADKRQAILDAALTLFAERGYHGTAMPELAAAAKVGAGTLYRYFTSKEELVNTLFRTWKGLLFNQLVENFPTDAPARQKFHLFCSRLCEFALEHPAGFTFLELHHHSPYLNEESRQLEVAVLTLVRSYVVQAQKDLVIREMHPEVAMALVWGAFVGVLKAGEMGYVKVDATVLKETEEVMWQAIRI